MTKTEPIDPSINTCITIMVAAAPQTKPATAPLSTSYLHLDLFHMTWTNTGGYS